MSAEITLNLPNSTLEELRCFICKGYLSCSPVRLLANGNCICGCCSPLNTDTCVHRHVAFEAILSKMSFPCAFKKYGCSETLLFGETADHESKCVHKSVACPTKTSTTCSWEGSLLQLLHHFADKHPNFLEDQATFQFDLDKDVQGILMATQDLSLFIVRYIYNANERTLKYDVRICNNQNGLDVFSKMQLINGADEDCNTNLKMIECLPYDESFCSMQNAKVLNIKNFMDCLSDPDCIVVTLKLVIKSNRNNVTIANNVAEEQQFCECPFPGHSHGVCWFCHRQKW